MTPDTRTTENPEQRLAQAFYDGLRVGEQHGDDPLRTDFDRWQAANQYAQQALALATNAGAEAAQGAAPRAEGLEPEFWKAAGEWQKAGSGMTREQETGAAMVWSWLQVRLAPQERRD